MKIPSFPPVFEEWQPGNPFKFEPPFPRWTNPWFTAEQAAIIEAESGKWARARSEAMTSPADGFEIARRLARQMYENMKSRALAMAPAPPKAKRPRKLRIEEEVGRALSPRLTPEVEERLADAALESLLDIRERFRRSPTTEDKIELAKTVVVWAEEEGFTITEDKGAEIANKAMSRFAPARA